MISASASSAAAAANCCQRRASRLLVTGSAAAVRATDDSSVGARYRYYGSSVRKDSSERWLGGLIPSRGGTQANKSTFTSSGGIAAAASSVLAGSSVGDYVKSHVLEEVTRMDSDVWEADDLEPSRRQAIRLSKASDSKRNGERRVNVSKASSRTVANGATSSIDHHSPIAHPSIDDSIGGHDNLDYNSPDRLDDEWHLNERPGKYFDVQNGNSPIPPDGVLPAAMADPFELAKSEIDLLSEGIRRDLIGTDHPVLNRAASYFFDEQGGGGGGKKVRPVMVMLISGALETRERRLHDMYGGRRSHPSRSPRHQRPDLIDAQRRLGQISEMIHTASLFHDDVIDGADTRRGVPTVHGVFGNKVAILAGDFLLARASIYLARLRDVEVVETMSTIIEHLVRGEVMQMRPPSDDDSSSDVRAQLEYYLHKTYYKTASLMANSCKSAAILGGHDPDVVDACYRYGKHVGMAFQLVDDVLDFTGDSSTTGKPALSDLNAGLATAPVLFAAEELPLNEGGLALREMTGRKFRGEGDVDAAVELVVHRSRGVERTKELARVHAELAIDAALELGGLPPAGNDDGFVGGCKNEHRDGLIHLAYKIVHRTR